MSFDWSAVEAAIQTDVVRTLGTTATLQRPTASGDPWAPTVTWADETVRVVWSEYTDRERDGTLVQIGDRRVILSTEGLTAAPTTADRLLAGGVAYEIVNVTRVAPAGGALMYEMQVRG